MKYPLRHVCCCFFALLLVSPQTALAQTPFAGEDFDGGTTNGMLTGPTSSVFTPDNSGFSPRGRFTNSGSFFDRFGVVSQEVDDGMGGTTGDALPFDFIDQSAGAFPADRMGILDSTKTDNVVVLVDTRNDQNPSGVVTAQWTFDISGRSNLGLSVDMAAIGDFDSDDDFKFEYSIDGGTTMTAFDAQVDEVFNPEFEDFSKTNILYSINMENESLSDRYTFPFFEENEWFDVVDQIGTAGLDYHPRDNGMDGDTTAQDGLIPITFLTGTEEVRAYMDGPFDQAEFLAFRNPIFVNPTDPATGAANNFATGTQLTDDYQTVSADLEGTGDTLTITFTGMTNDSAGQEFFTFDNLVLTEGEADTNIWDFEPDGDVDITDFGFFADAFINGSPLPGTNGYGDGEPDGDVDITDFGNFADAFNASASASSIPEPTAAVLAVLAAVGFAARRNG